jgi:hypothetical protein
MRGGGGLFRFQSLEQAFCRVTVLGHHKRDQSTQNIKFRNDFVLQIVTGSYPVLMFEFVSRDAARDVLGGG